MEKDFGTSDPKLAQYTLDTFFSKDTVLENVLSHANQNRVKPIQVTPIEGRLLEILARSARAEKIVEIGTLAGYSGVCLARALPEQGKLYTIEINEKNAEIARKSFQLAGLEKKVQILLGPAMENLPKIEKQGPFDLVFIDADKAPYPEYLTWATQNLRVGGLVIGDNTFCFGRVVQNQFKTTAQKKSVEGIRTFNSRLAQSPQFRSVILPTAMGLTIGVKLN